MDVRLLLLATLLSPPLLAQPHSLNIQEASLKAPLTYDRSTWAHWQDYDEDCQNTRQELLLATSKAPVTFTSTSNCTTYTGMWLDPYTGDYYTLASDLDIDHIIPLSYAYGHGGSLWSLKLKELFANDLENLLAVDDGLNASKGDKGPSDWMPPSETYHCMYANKWRVVANKYGLVLAAEDDAKISEVLKGCKEGGELGL